MSFNSKEIIFLEQNIKSSQNNAKEGSNQIHQGKVQSFKFAKNLKVMQKEPEYQFSEQDSATIQKIDSKQNEQNDKIISYEPLALLTDRQNFIEQKQSLEHFPVQVHNTYDQQRSQLIEQDFQMVSPKQDSLRKFLLILRVKKNVQIFINTLSERSYILLKRIKPKILKFMEEEYIKDERDFKKFPKQINQLSLIFKENDRERNHYYRINVFTPGNKFLLIWEVLLILISLFLLWWVPFRVCFNTELFAQEQKLLYLMICMYIIDIFLKFNTGFFYQGQIVKERKFIIQNYFKGDAFKDISSFILIVIYIITQNNLELIMSMYILFGYQRLKIKIVKIQEQFEEINIQSEPFDIIKLITMIFLIAHFIACLWHYVGLIGLQTNDESWITFYGIEKQNIWTHYNYSIYWATMTMVTVGYGDITPKNDLELVTANIVMYIACGVFAFSVNSIGIILQNLNEGLQKHKRTYSILNNYLNKNGVSVDLQCRIRNYIDYSFLQQETSFNDEAIQSIISKLSKQLREELLLQVTSKGLYNSKVLSDNFSQETLKKVSLHIEIQNYCPDDKIITQNQIDDQSLYIIQKGKVILIEEQTKKNLGILSKGDIFGEWAFFTGQTRVCTVQSSDFTTVYKIKREIFLSIIKEIPNEFEKFHEIKDKLIYQQDFSLCNMQCLCCESKNHMITQCPQVQYKPDIERILKRQIFSRPSERKRVFRNKPIKAQYRNTLYKAQEIQITQLKFLSQYQKMSQIKDSQDIGSPDDPLDQDELSAKSEVIIKEKNENVLVKIGNNTESLLLYESDPSNPSESQNLFHRISEKSQLTQKQRQQDDKHISDNRNTVIQSPNIVKNKDEQQNQRKSDNSIYQQMNNQSQNLITNQKPSSQFLIADLNSKGTKKISFNNLTELEYSNQTFNHSGPITQDIDLMMNFKLYFSYWNSDKICKKVYRQGKLKRKIPNAQENTHLSQYTFFFNIKKRIARLLRYLKLQNNKDASGIHSNRSQQFKRSECKQQIILDIDSQK